MSEKKKKINIGLLLAVVLIIPCHFLVAGPVYSQSHGQYWLDGVLIKVIAAPLIVTVLFLCSKENRNLNSSLKVFFWTSLILFLGSVGEYLSLV